MNLKYLVIASILLLQTGCNSEKQNEAILSATAQQIQPSTTPSAQPLVQSGGKITGKQYIVLGKGATAIADNQISFIPCAERAECDKELSEIATIVSQANSQIYKDEKFNSMVSGVKSTNDRLSAKVSHVNSNFEGNYTVNCPSKYCLIYSIGQAGFTAGLWGNVTESGSSLDLSNSNMLTSVDR